MALCCNFGLSVWCMSCCFVAVIWAYDTWSFGVSRVAKLSPGEAPPPVCAAVYPVEGRDKDVFISIQSPTGNNSKLQDSWRWRNFPLPKLSPSTLSPGNRPPLVGRDARKCRDVRCIEVSQFEQFLQLMNVRPVLVSAPVLPLAP